MKVERILSLDVKLGSTSLQKLQYSLSLCQPDDTCEHTTCHMPCRYRTPTPTQFILSSHSHSESPGVTIAPLMGVEASFSSHMPVGRENVGGKRSGDAPIDLQHDDVPFTQEPDQKRQRKYSRG